MGIDTEDTEAQSSRFFSRAKNIVNQDAIKECPCYGLSNTTFGIIIEEKAKMELSKKLQHLGIA